MVKPAIISIATISALFILHGISLSANNNLSTYHNQSPAVNSIILAEKNPTHRASLIQIINSIDQVYSSLPENLQNGGKLVIFFDPAHGKLPNGKWQGGDATRRTSCTGLPEEYYSILISRALYDLLRNNQFIEIKSTDDFMDVLQGKSDSYRDIPFTKTVELADRSGAFIIISEHLNNISVLYKADGLVNIPGIHITRNGYGVKVLQYVRDIYDGFLTLYNRFDASGFSSTYAHRLRRILVAHGLKPNSWEMGAVGDSRFSYFVDFPVSVIFESGFISNPEEEQRLRDPEHIKKITNAQYRALLDTIEEIFKIDISGNEVKKKGEIDQKRIDLLKLARITIYYIKNGEVVGGLRAIDTLERVARTSPYSDNVRYFSHLKQNLIAASRYYQLAKAALKKKNHRKARACYAAARRHLMRSPVFASLHEKYRAELRTPEEPAAVATSKIVIPERQSGFSPFVSRAPLERHIIFPIEYNQPLEEAIQLALQPDAAHAARLIKSFKDARHIEKRTAWIFSAKKKRRIAKLITEEHRITFTPGIYIVRLDRNCNVVEARRANSVALDPSRYQNQQYLKNSFFASDARERAL